MSDPPLGERVARVEAMVEVVQTDVREIRDELRDVKKMLSERLDEQEARLATLERWRSWMLGAAATIGVAADAFWRWLTASNK
ncbi:MAG TPA: hypothetical protein VIK99_01330 [Thermaerobacter sp.]